MNCECGQPIKARGLCQKHYLVEYRQRKASGQIVKAPLTFTVRHDNQCAVVDCFNVTRAKGLCTKHYFQTRRANK